MSLQWDEFNQGNWNKITNGLSRIENTVWYISEGLNTVLKIQLYKGERLQISFFNLQKKYTNNVTHK